MPMGANHTERREEASVENIPDFEARDAIAKLAADRKYGNSQPRHARRGLHSNRVRMGAEENVSGRQPPAEGWPT